MGPRESIGSCSQQCRAASPWVPQQAVPSHGRGRPLSGTSAGGDPRVVSVACCSSAGNNPEGVPSGASQDGGFAATGLCLRPGGPTAVGQRLAPLSRASFGKGSPLGDVVVKCTALRRVVCSEGSSI